MLPNELLNDLRLRILGNYEISAKSTICLELMGKYSGGHLKDKLLTVMLQNREKLAVKRSIG